MLAPTGTRNGREIFQRFRDGLAEPVCQAPASVRWQAHFAQAPGRLVTDDVLPLFGYVVDAVREAYLPTEFALIPFVESGYRPGARSPQGSAGLWQLIAITARHHKVPMRAGYDGRLSPIDATTAAVRYLKTLHGMFAGDWRLAAMAYNAGEYRVLGALRRSGQTARDARPETLPGLSPITHAYVRKLHALSCLMEQAEGRAEWLHALDRPVPRLQVVTVPGGIGDIATWARRHGQDAARLRRLNPAYVDGRLSRTRDTPARLLVMATDPGPLHTGVVDGAVAASTAGPVPPAPEDTTPATDEGAGIGAPGPAAAEVVGNTPTPARARRHTVVRGDTASGIATRYGVPVTDLQQRNGLDPNSDLRPGTVLQVDAERSTGSAPTAADARGHR